MSRYTKQAAAHLTEQVTRLSRHISCLKGLLELQGTAGIQVRRADSSLFNGDRSDVSRHVRIVRWLHDTVKFIVDKLTPAGKAPKNQSSIFFKLESAGIQLETGGSFICSELRNTTTSSRWLINTSTEKDHIMKSRELLSQISSEGSIKRPGLVGLPELQQLLMAEETDPYGGRLLTPSNSTPICRSHRQVMQSPVPWSGQEPAIVLSKDEGFFGINSIRPSDLIHGIATGNTGCGKSVSFVIPLLKGMIRYQLPEGKALKRMAILVIDPKYELSQVTQAVLREQGELDRFVHIGGDKNVAPVQFFSVDQCLTPVEKLERLDAVLGTKSLAEGSHGYWHSAGKSLVRQIMDIEETGLQMWDRSLTEDVFTKLFPLRPPGGFWSNLQSFFNYSREGEKCFNKAYLAFEAVLEAADLSGHEFAGFMRAFRGDHKESSISTEQWHYRMQSFEPLMSVLADPDVAKLINFEPFPRHNQPALNLVEAMEEGKVVLFQPGPRENLNLAGRAIKAKWYEAVTSRNDLLRPVALVADEFQRFVSLDPVFGEPGILDVARAYRFMCICATQSIASLSHALGAGEKAERAIEVILANCPSKFFFASKDKKTADVLRSVISAPPIDGPHIADVRPLAQLGRGEAFWSLADGRWGLGKARLEVLL